jgi:hypothetical protein
MTTPTGKLAYGQPQTYDAVDDRSVIAVVTNGRLGLVRPVVCVPGSGLQLIVRANWAGVASCDDGTSAVVGSREDQVVQANPGQAGQPREDVLWCDTDPDEGTWELSVMPRSAATGRAGIPLVWITAPPNANLATALTLRPVDASIERRLMAYQTRNDTAVRQSTLWANSAGWELASQEVTMEPGQWYRVRYQTNSAQLVAAPSGFRENGELRMGIGYRQASQVPALSVLAREVAINFSYVGGTTPGYQHAEVEWIFRHSATDQQFDRVFCGRVWSIVNGVQFRVNGSGLSGSQQMISVEDIGS